MAGRTISMVTICSVPSAPGTLMSTLPVSSFWSRAPSAAAALAAERGNAAAALGRLRLRLRALAFRLQPHLLGIDARLLGSIAGQRDGALGARLGDVALQLALDEMGELQISGLR